MTDVAGQRSLHGQLLIVRRNRGLQLIETEETTRHRTTTAPTEITTAAAGVEVAAADVAAKDDVDRGEAVTPLRTAVMTETGLAAAARRKKTVR